MSALPALILKGRLALTYKYSNLDESNEGYDVYANLYLNVLLNIIFNISHNYSLLEQSMF